jgi:hypothetical protein
MKSAPIARKWLLTGILCASVVASASAPEGAGTLDSFEGPLHGFPALLDLQGRKLADGEFNQWVENGLLHVRIDYEFGGGRRVEEKTSFHQKPELVQEKWSWTESTSGQEVRHFEIDFTAGKALAQKHEGKDTKRWAEDLKIEPHTFAGFGFVLAIKTVRERLVRGQRVEFKAIGFTPKPRLVSVELAYGGVDKMKMAGREVEGDRFTIHPKVPAIAKVFVETKDTHIWLTRPPAVSFLRWEGGFVEVSDAVIRVDLLPGERSGSAEPANPASR